MKKSNLYGRYLMAVLLTALVFQFGCKREEGYYSTSNANVGTTLNTYDYLKSKTGVYDSLLLLIDKLGMQSYLKDSSVTLFAPSNESFRIALENLNSVRKTKGKGAIFLTELASGKSLLPADIGKAKADSSHIDTMVSQYIIRGIFKSTDFSVGDGRDLISARSSYPMHGKRLYADAQGMQNGGSEIIQFANTRRSVFVPNWTLTNTNSVNIQTKNGVVHLLETDHVFGFSQFTSRLTFVPPPTNLTLLDITAFNNALPQPTQKPYSVKFNGSYQDGGVSSGERIDKLFDNNPLTKFIAQFNDGNNAPILITYKFFNGPAVANVYTMTSANDSENRDPKSWRLEGSIDGTNWTLLDTRQDQTFESRFQTKIYDFPNTVAYGYYRLTILTNRTDGLFQLAEWTMNYRTTYN